MKMGMRGNWAIPVLASILILGSAILVETTFLTTPISAEAKQTVQCTGTPFVFPNVVTQNFEQLEKGFLITYEARGGLTTLDCTDDSHPLEGKTVVVNKLTSLSFKTSGDDFNGMVKGKTKISLSENDTILFIGHVKGTGECDESGICQLATEVKANSQNGIKFDAEADLLYNVGDPATTMAEQLVSVALFETS